MNSPIKATCIFWFDKAYKAPNTGEYIECWIRTVRALINNNKGMPIDFGFGHTEKEVYLCPGLDDLFDVPKLKETIIDMCKKMGIYY